MGERQGSMGIASGDFDRNGFIDLHVTNFWNQPADLFMQLPTGLFGNKNANRGLYKNTHQTVAWGTQAVDFDRDGWLDLVVLNGHVTDHRHLGQPLEMEPQLFGGKTDGFHLIDPTSLGDPYWEDPKLGRIVVNLDWNGDRRTDLVVNHLEAPAALLENQTEGGDSISFELSGVTSERDAIGAKLSIECNDLHLTQWVTGGDGLLCTNEAVVEFGLGNASEATGTIDRLKVHWPSGLQQIFTAPKVNCRYLIVEGQPTLFKR
ncbi:ASPIC and UnbV [Planctomycetes bacterium CA13]|uniref:ASPIC and UnbV n=2 Tax=Novipirellula herctigrandis TaxID=2527986 RepID=A0A5C5Z7I5_9BACT|nr:ASPIC and UnbV [Planctomycetes bacterium CA13]